MKPWRIKHGGIMYRWYQHPYFKPIVAISLQLTIILLLIVAILQLQDVKESLNSYKQVVDVCLHAGSVKGSFGFIQFGNHIFECKMEYLDHV